MAPGEPLVTSSAALTACSADAAADVVASTAWRDAAAAIEPADDINFASASKDELVELLRSHMEETRDLRRKLVKLKKKRVRFQCALRVRSASVTPRCARAQHIRLNGADVDCTEEEDRLRKKVMALEAGLKRSKAVCADLTRSRDEEVQDQQSRLVALEQTVKEQAVMLRATGVEAMQREVERWKAQTDRAVCEREAALQELRLLKESCFHSASMSRAAWESKMQMLREGSLDAPHADAAAARACVSLPRAVHCMSLLHVRVTCDTSMDCRITSC
jgi:hypothetical protein